MRKERDLFAALPTIDEAVSRRLHQRLVDAASAAGLLDVAYRTIETPVGTLLLAAPPKAVRAVGSACATNPLPVVVPCHRVVRSDGTIGQYVGGVEAKHMLLALESAA